MTESEFRQALQSLADSAAPAALIGMAQGIGTDGKPKVWGQAASSASSKEEMIRLAAGIRLAYLLMLQGVADRLDLAPAKVEDLLKKFGEDAPFRASGY